MFSSEDISIKLFQSFETSDFDVFPIPAFLVLSVNETIEEW